jgi:HPt (histidine-containing phosphotransfer) domain-containing protein
MDTHEIVDRAALDRLVEWGGDKLLRQMLRLFLENSRVRLDGMRDALATGGDLDEVHRGAHSLKSSAANVGAMRVSAVAARLESVADAGDREESATLFEDLVAAWDEAEVRLQRVLERVEA